MGGSSLKHGLEVRIRLVSPMGEAIQQSFWLVFNASNNEAEYEALFAGLRLALRIGVKELNVLNNSQLATNQFSGEYEAKNESMKTYLKLFQSLTKQFYYIELTRIRRDENTSAYAIATLASTSDHLI